MSIQNERYLLPPLVNEYVSDLIVVKGRSKLTVNEYISDLRLFFRFIISKNNNLKSPSDLPEDYDLSFVNERIIEKITLRDVNEFLIYCSDERSDSLTTRSRKASSIRGFFKYICDKMHYIENNPVSQLQVAPSKKKLPKYLSLEESRQLLNSVSGENMIRDYCILTLFLNCGIRLAELVNLNIHDVDFNKQSMVVTGKGNKQRVVFLNNACIAALKDYLKVRPVDSLKGDDRNALFISRLNKIIGRQAVQLMVYKSLQKIGLDGQHYSVHKLRHTAATLTYQYGDVDVLVLKEMLGHENLSTTEIYTHLENKQLREAASSNPLSNEKNNLKSEK